MVLISSIGTAVSNTSNTWATVTRPGARFRLMTCAFGPFFVAAG